MTNIFDNPCFEFTEEEFFNAKSREKLKCHCSYCNNTIFIEKHFIQSKIKKNSFKFFCGRECAGKYLITSIKTNCTNCGKEITVVKHEYEKSKSHHFFCSQSCAAIYNNAHRKHCKKINLRTEEERTLLKENNRKRKNENAKKVRALNRKCRVCGQNVCKHPEICKSGFFIFSNNLIKIGFDMSTLGSEKVYDEYERIKKYLYSLYHEKMMSYPNICKMHNIPKENTIMLLFKFFNIKPRTFSESSINSFEQGKRKIPENSPIRFKSGYHTTWDNKNVYYRSSYELKYMKELDNKKVSYDVESLHIKYFNTTKNRYAIAIPDFYIPSTNTIVEVKSAFTYNKNEMVDKMNAYKKLGYNFILLYEHKEYNDCIEQKKKHTIKDYI